MKSFKCLLIALGLIAGANVHAVKSCMLMIPAGCEVINSNYSASPHDTTHVLQVDCRMPDGSFVKYLTSRQAIASTLFGFGRDFIPSRIAFAEWQQDAIQINCR